MSWMFPLMVSIIFESAFNLLDQRTVSFFTFISTCMTCPEMGGGFCNYSQLFSEVDGKYEVFFFSVFTFF